MTRGAVQLTESVPDWKWYRGADCEAAGCVPSRGGERMGDIGVEGARLTSVVYDAR